jgi:hypothetical protein
MSEPETSSTPIDLAPLGPILERYAPQGRTTLLPALIEAQQVYCYLPEPKAKLRFTFYVSQRGI